ncbi:MAG TPA: hypothetical protein VKM55_20620 [Candidatus Lokiarchaeia archaeon]|nr:hypothetical protein [Candidatus Lokiarchaeia archaeon]
MNKKKILVALLCGSIVSGLIPLAKADYSSYLGITIGNTYTFTYTESPQIRGVTRNINLPITIQNIADVISINSSASNVTYQTTFTVEKNGIPVNQETEISVIINNSMDLFNFVNNSNSPFGIFFIFSSPSGKTINITGSEHSKLGNGTITWTANGILQLATLATIIDNQTCTITIAVANQGGSTPGYSIPLIGCMLVGAVILIGNKLVKKEKKKIAAP